MFEVPHTSVLDDTAAAKDSYIRVETFCAREDGTSEEPINREMPMQELTSHWLTLENNYDRNHGPILHLNRENFRVTIDGLVRRPKSLSVADLEAMPQHRITASLLCAGNRRHTMRTRLKEVKGVDWFDGAVMNCLWEGPRLSTVLRHVGIDDKDSAQPLHIQFACHQTAVQDDSWYGGSIPLDRAMDDEMDVILAIKMNNHPLEDRHGFPVRSIVPGVLGARSVKWLDRITVATEESPNTYQRKDYKVLPPSVHDMEEASQWWDKIEAMMDMPINSCVASPSVGSTIKLDASGQIDCHGYAVPFGAHGPVTRVEVSGDEGKTWRDAELDAGPSDLRSKWTWVLWKVKLKMTAGSGRRIWSRATDSHGNTQTEERSEWNLRGVAYNGMEGVWDLTIE